MKSILKSLGILSCIFLSSTLFAQLDNNNNGSKEKGKIKRIALNNSKEVTKPKSLDLDGTKGFMKAFDKENKKLKEKLKEEALKNKGILTKEKINEAHFLKSFKRINGQYIIPKIDQDLGSIRTASKSINIICRDFQYPDGDRITIYVNDIPVVHNITLKSSYQKFNIPLKIGINKIAFKALNQGTSGPNTAAFKIYNDAGMLISSNEWNLATDAKATLIIAKDK